MKRNSRNVETVALIAMFLILNAIALAQGPLTPPGPPEPTMKSLDEIFAKAADATSASQAILSASEPRIPIGPDTTPGDASVLFIISKPGAYYFRSNIAGVEGKSGISITTDNVALDLGGFSFQGARDYQFGILSYNNHLTIAHGSIAGWGGSAIRINNHSSIEKIKVSSCGAGLTAASYCLIRQCQVDDSQYYGIYVNDGSCVSDCVCTSSGGTGIIGGAASVIARNSCTYGVGGIVCGGSGAIIVKNACSFNSGYGIAAGMNSIILRNNCTFQLPASFGPGTGILLNQDRNYVDGNFCANNEVGIAAYLNQKAVVVRNILGANSTANIQDGGGNKIAPLVSPDVATNPFSNLLMD